MGRRDLRKLATSIHRSPGDALAGDQVIAEARKIGPTMVVTGTSSHRMQEVVLKRNVLCVIDLPFKLIEDAMKLKDS